MVFNLESLKNEIRDTLRLYLYPECLEGTVETTLSVIKNSSTINIDIAQSFIPFTSLYVDKDSTQYTMPVTLKFKKYGSPTNGLSVYVVEDSSTIPTGDTVSTSTVSPSDVSTVSTSVTLNMTFTEQLDSKDKYWIKIEPNNSESTVNYYSIINNSIDTKYIIGTSKTLHPNGTWSPYSKDVYFDCSIPDWIYGNYPYEELSIYSYPRVAVDITGRPRVEQRWIDHRLSKYYLNCNVIIYSRYADELDDIVSYVDRALFKERINTDSFRILNPGNITPLAIIREDLFSKALSYSCVYKMYET